MPRNFHENQFGPLELCTNGSQIEYNGNACLLVAVVALCKGDPVKSTWAMMDLVLLKGSVNYDRLLQRAREQGVVYGDAECLGIDDMRFIGHQVNVGVRRFKMNIERTYVGQIVDHDDGQEIIGPRRPRLEKALSVSDRVPILARYKWVAVQKSGNYFCVINSHNERGIVGDAFSDPAKAIFCKTIQARPFKGVTTGFSTELRASRQWCSTTWPQFLTRFMQSRLQKIRNSPAHEQNRIFVLTQAKVNLNSK